MADNIRQLVWCQDLKGYIRINGDYLPGMPIVREQFDCSRANKKDGTFYCSKDNEECIWYKKLSLPYEKRRKVKG